MEDLTVAIAGADRVRAVLGAWPSFHDAEVPRVELTRAGDRIAVVVDPTAGLLGVEGSFTCAAVEVVAVEARPTTPSPVT